MSDDLLSLIQDTKLCGAIARLVKRVLVAAIDPDMTQRYSRKFLQLPAHPTPIYRSHDGRKVVAVSLLVKELGEDLLRTLQPFRFAALPMHDRVSIILPLDAVPGKGTDFYRFARQLGSTQI
jgi:hypothetical protein